MTFTWKSMFRLAWGQTTPGPSPPGGPEIWVREGEGGAEGGSRHATPSPRVLFSSSLRLSQRFLSSWATMACGTVVSPAFLSHSLCPGHVGGGQCPLALQPRTCISKQLHTQSGLSSVVHQYFQIPGHRPLELLTWHLGLLGLILGRDPPLASVRAAGVVQQRGEHSAGAGTHPSLRFHSLLWAPGAGRRGSPLLPGEDDAHLSGLWGGSPEVFAGCEVLRRP